MLLLSAVVRKLFIKIMDISSITNLGTAGFAIFVMWQMSKMFIATMEKEREASRNVEKEVRGSIMKQLSENTVALQDVIKHLDK